MSPPLALRLVVSSGEALPPRLLRRLRAVLPPGAAVLNLYGSTEVAGDCTCFNASSWQPAGSGLQLERGGAWENPSAGTASADQPASRAAVGASPCDGGEPPWKRARWASPDEADSASDPQTGAAPAANPASGSGQPGAQVPVGAPIDNTTVFVMRLRSGAPDSAAPCDWGQAATAAAPDALALDGSVVILAAVDEVGEVCVAGPGLAAGYLRQADANARFCVVPASLLRAEPGAAVLHGPPAPLPGAVPCMLVLPAAAPCMLISPAAAICMLVLVQHMLRFSRRMLSDTSCHLCVMGNRPFKGLAP